MFLGSVASAGLFLGSLTTALLGSNATLPQNDPLDTECSSQPMCGWGTGAPILDSTDLCSHDVGDKILPVLVCQHFRV